MNVRELINELGKHNPNMDLTVVIRDLDGDLCETEVVGAEPYGDDDHPFLLTLRAGGLFCERDGAHDH